MPRAIILSFLIVMGARATALIDGVKPKTGTFPSSVMLATVGDSFCSGVVIAPRFVLTAAHCMTGWGGRYLKGNGELSLTINKLDEFDMLMEYTFLTVRAVYVHPTFPLDSDGSGDLSRFSDLALIELEHPVPIPTASLDYRSLKKGDEVVVQGFGCKGKDRRGIGSLTYARKSISGFRGQDILLSRRSLDHRHGGELCQGDSGGPVYEIGSNGRLNVVGINSETRHILFFNTDMVAKVSGVKAWITAVLSGHMRPTYTPEADF